MIISNSSFYCVFVLLVTFILFLNKTIADHNKFLKSDDDQIAHIFPCHKDLRVYLNSLERIINFAYAYRDDLDFSFSFGLFLVNVHLEPFTDDSLPELKNHIERLIRRSDRTLDFLNSKRGGYDKKDVDYKIFTFFKNYTFWSKRLNKLNFELPRGKGLPSDRNKEYPDWRVYVHHVDDIDNWEPSPQQSGWLMEEMEENLMLDLCMASLAETEENFSKYLRKCKLPENCYKILLNGTNFGYALTHRLLFLLFARFGRGCTVFSKTKDRRLRRRFCNNIYNEAKYIAYNRYRHVDLMFEQIAFCTMDAHAKFLRQTWLSNLLRYQTTHGCFGQHLPSFRQHLPTFSQQVDKDSEEVNWKYDVMNGTCNGHVTAVAAASIAAAVRFILENY